VQLAAYESADKARDLISSLRGKGIEAFHQQGDVEGTTWHRVRVGVYASRAEAELGAARLVGASPFDPYVTRIP
jgi:cell division septation protein DedD